MRMYFGRLSRRLLTQLLLLMALPVAAQAQTSTLTSPSTMSVRSFTLLESDLTAQNRTTMVLDQNGDKCALIRIQTTQKGFSFDVGSAGVQKVEDNHVAEVWVYVPFGVRHISIRHPQLGSLRYDFPINIQKARTYEMVLSAGQVQTIVQQDLGGSYFVMNVAPANAIVVVDDAEQVVEEGVVSMFLTYGRHSYRVSSPLYQSEAGNIEIGLEKKTLDISLKPDYGQLEISTTPENGARVYIDGSETPAGTTPFTTDRLPSGEHTLRLQLAQYESRTMQVTLPSDGSTQPLSVALTPTYGILNIKAPQGCHIYVNNEDKGADFWSGRLSAGPYVVEARRASHRSTSQRVDVVRGEEQRIELAAPTPIYGSLNVSSKPVGAEVYLDGTKLGTTPDIFRNVLEGTHSIELRKPGFAAYTEQVTITEGKVSDLSATLSAEEKPKPAATYTEQVTITEGKVSDLSATLSAEEKPKPAAAKLKNVYYVELALRAGAYPTAGDAFEHIIDDFRVGGEYSLAGVGGCLGGYFPHFNAELSAYYMGDNREIIYWYDGSTAPRRSEYKTQMSLGARLGYGFLLGKHFWITPQAGANLLCLRDGNWDEITKITSAVLGLRMSIPWNHFWLSLTPEYSYDLTDYGILEGVSSTFEGWCQGLNVKFGLMVTF